MYLRIIDLHTILSKFVIIIEYCLNWTSCISVKKLYACLISDTLHFGVVTI